MFWACADAPAGGESSVPGPPCPSGDDGNPGAVALVETGPATTCPGDGLSTSLSVSPNYLLVGAIQDEVMVANSGAVYVYTSAGGNWLLHETFEAATPAGGSENGRSVSVDGSQYVIGATGKSNTNGYASSSAMTTLSTAEGNCMCKSGYGGSECSVNVTGEQG